ncbi:uncharacterized protein CTHT_0027910 [Thermochaetoides thermophila DSM 1495]|uniref:Protein BIG1 n=1 Tax=Chaetomium thermophilum (strain DSM 1495 / CBS 144.50 / IMI 039719) TaxID=759272 RepID=G0S7F0_CHATD|nr:hypothetical protein CTHT_0027910 [Thermochaetoides thermophila DSM 1495]EGS20952.1 hypothetical protein CTHT_0027910 [Thermochaetoides thermophila DSM 1495]
MHLLAAVSLLACATAQAHAFSDSSPFVLFSTAKYVNLSLPPYTTVLTPHPLSGETKAAPNTPQLQTADSVFTSVKQLLAKCPTRRYILVSQPNVHAADLRKNINDETSSGGCLMPNLCRTVSSMDKSKVFSVAEVIGQLSVQSLAEYIEDVCAKQRAVDVEVEKLGLKHLPAVGSADEERKLILGDNDHELGRLLEALDDDYTVIMFSDSNEFTPYQPKFSSPVVDANLKQKRWSAEPEKIVPVNRKAKFTADKRSLFEKYQFFTPGVFMALITLFILLSILGAGLKAIASLQVSYGAFDKEMGPAAQKKQM